MPSSGSTAPQASKAMPKPKRNKVPKRASESVGLVKISSSEDDEMVDVPNKVKYQTTLVDGVERPVLQPGDPVYAQDWQWCENLGDVLKWRLMDEDQIADLVMQRTAFDEMIDVPSTHRTTKLVSVLGLVTRTLHVAEIVPGSNRTD